MPRKRFTGRYMGLGGQFIKQALDKNLLKMILTPAFKEKIREEFGCSDEDINKAVQMGITEFGDDFKELLVEQRAMFTPPKEDENETTNPQ